MVRALERVKEESITVERAERPGQIALIEDLLTEFHRRAQGLPYPLVWTLQTLPRIVMQSDTVMLIAREQGSPCGYMWAQINGEGECFVYQVFALHQRATDAMFESMRALSDHLGLKQWGALYLLRPQERKVLEGLPTMKYIRKRYGFVPRSILMIRTPTEDADG